MVWFVVGVYLSAAATAGIGLLAAALGPWGIVALAGGTLTVLGLTVEGVTRQGKQGITPQADRAISVPPTIIWSLLG